MKTASLVFKCLPLTSRKTDSRSLLVLGLVVYLSLYIRETVISFTNSLIALWIAFAINFGKSRLSFILPAAVCAVISGVAFISDILVSILPTSGQVYLL